MPQKPNQGTPPHRGDGKMDEQVGRELYGGSGSHQGPGKLEKEGEGNREGHASGASGGGAGRNPGSSGA